jgi:hypothetical protein
MALGMPVGRKVYQAGANALLGLDLVFMLFDGFPGLVRHAHIVWALEYLAALIGLVLGPMASI